MNHFSGVVLFAFQRKEFSAEDASRQRSSSDFRYVTRSIGSCFESRLDVGTKITQGSCVRFKTKVSKIGERSENF